MAPLDFADVVAEVTATAGTTPASDTPQHPPTSAAGTDEPDIDRGTGGPVPAAADGRIGTGPVRKGEGAAAPSPTAPPVIVDPETGEVLDLAVLDPDRIAALVETVKAFVEEATRWRRAAEDELDRRLGKDKLRVWGDWEVARQSGRGRRWDADALQAVLAEAISNGTVLRADVADIIRPGEPTVDGALAARLLNRVGEKLRGELNECFTWERKSRETVRVTRVPDLEAALPEASPAGAGDEPTTEGRSGQDG